MMISIQDGYGNYQERINSSIRYMLRKGLFLRYDWSKIVETTLKYAILLHKKGLIKDRKHITLYLDLEDRLQVSRKEEWWRIPIVITLFDNHNNDYMAFTNIGFYYLDNNKFTGNGVLI